MNRHEPNAQEITTGDAHFEELSIEEVARMEREDIPDIDAIVGLQGMAPAEVAPTAGEGEEKIPETAATTPSSTAAATLYRLVSGRYESCPRNWQLVLRVDVDGSRPFRYLSGDYFRFSGNTTSYFGSFIVNPVKIEIKNNMVYVTGVAETTWNTSYKYIRVIIPRHTTLQPQANAYVQWYSSTGRQGAAYTCQYQSRYFRMVELEQDYEKGVKMFNSYNTGSLTSGGPARTLTVTKAYAEAGIEMNDIGRTNVVGGADGETWDNAELHHAMEQNFSRWQDIPQWKVWLFHANLHVLGTGLYGIMFDQHGKQRQGCAVFYAGIGGSSAEKQRDQLYTCVHELGHCFNLFHSFHKIYMTPPMPNRLKSLSWMNYPWNYPGGANTYWNNFAFQFDNLETIHLRHAFRDNIIMGGNPFGTGAALEKAEMYADNVADNSGLNLELSIRKSHMLGEPVVASIKLNISGPRALGVHKELHPNFNFVKIGVQKPGGEVIAYHPPIDHCIVSEIETLSATNLSIADSAYVGFDGHHGLVFDQPGLYKMRAVYHALDGSIVLSNVATTQVLNPVTKADAEVADLFMGEEQGMLLYLLGSDSEFLKKGNDALDTVLDKHDKHPLAVYANLVKGCALKRDFKRVRDNFKISVRKSNPSESRKHLNTVISESKKGKGVDDITLTMVEGLVTSVRRPPGKKKK